MKELKDWLILEKQVRDMAEKVWMRTAVAEDINGVKCDCVLKIESDNYIIIEISKSGSLQKIRDDLAKFASIKYYLLSQQIYAKCYFVCDANLHPSIRSTGSGSHVSVFSPEEFESEFTGKRQYYGMRSEQAFGSSIDVDTGHPDQSGYIPVKYLSASGGAHGTKDIAEMVSAHKRKVILLGDFGAGKSRCVREVFGVLRESSSSSFGMCIAVNLKAHWGHKTGSMIIRNHVEDMGISEFADPLIRMRSSTNFHLLLDGFDEMGAQTWSNSGEKLREIRRLSLQGVKDLVSTSRGGVLITGRDHYFNSDQEMLDCLGLRKAETVILRCPSQFSESELAEYMRVNKLSGRLPEYIPRKPLVCQYYAKLKEEERQSMTASEGGESEFFDKFIVMVSKREAGMQNGIQDEAVKNILINLSRATRDKQSCIGPVSITEINQAFTQVTGNAPTDESAIVLQRLPFLGRTGSESLDRSFIDEYVVGGLRAMDLVKCITLPDEDSAQYLRWTNGLNEFGVRHLGHHMQMLKIDNEAMRVARLCAKGENKIMAIEVVAAIMTYSDSFDFKGLDIANSEVAFLDFSDKRYSNLSISDTVIGRLSCGNESLDNVSVSRCLIEKLIGVSGNAGVPPWIIKPSVESFDDLSNVSSIRELKLSDGNKILLVIIKKLFFQPGSGRKEAALLRGGDSGWNAKDAEKILQKMVAENIIDRFKGDEGLVYRPLRTHTERMRAIMSQMANSNDALWIYASTM